MKLRFFFILGFAFSCSFKTHNHLVYRFDSKYAQKYNLTIPQEFYFKIDQKRFAKNTKHKKPASESALLREIAYVSDKNIVEEIISIKKISAYENLDKAKSVLEELLVSMQCKNLSFTKVNSKKFHLKSECINKNNPIYAVFFYAVSSDNTNAILITGELNRKNEKIGVFSRFKETLTYNIINTFKFGKKAKTEIQIKKN